MTRYWYDLEFLGDGSTIRPISIGITSSDGREYYAVFEEIASDAGLYAAICRHKWLMENVIRHLPLSVRAHDNLVRCKVPNSDNRYQGDFTLDPESSLIRPKWLIANEVRDFLYAGDDEEIELWANWGAYDHVCLMQLWGTMVHRPARLPMYTNDLQQAIRTTPHFVILPEQSSGLHDALADAKHNRAVWEALELARRGAA